MSSSTASSSSTEEERKLVAGLESLALSSDECTSNTYTNTAPTTKGDSAHDDTKDTAATSTTAGVIGVEVLTTLLKHKRVKNVIVMSGAGISCSAGIPDFRTPGSGLYDNLQKYNLERPEHIFTLSYFRSNPKPFCTLAKELFPGAFAPTPAHHFLKLLHDKGVLLRNYTQNIDGLEALAGVPEEKIVQAHGGFGKAHCIDCSEAYSCEYVKEAVMNDKVPLCTQPASGQKGRYDKNTQRKNGSSNSDGKANRSSTSQQCGGYIKPDIVFFGENLPRRFHELIRRDMRKCDLLIVMGTSLMVHPFASLVHMVPDDCPRLLVNLEDAGQADDSPGVDLPSLMAAASPEDQQRLAALLRGDTIDHAALNALIKQLSAEVLAPPREGFLYHLPEENTRDTFLQTTTDKGAVQLAEGAGWAAELTALLAQGAAVH